MPVEKHKDRFFIPPGAKPTPHLPAHYVNLRDEAAAAINEYFHFFGRKIGDFTLDHIVHNCMILTPVRKFIDGSYADHSTHQASEELIVQQTMRERSVRNHITMKLKEYIDGRSH